MPDQEQEDSPDGEFFQGNVSGREYEVDGSLPVLDASGARYVGFHLFPFSSLFFCIFFSPL